MVGPLLPYLLLLPSPTTSSCQASGYDDICITISKYDVNCSVIMVVDYSASKSTHLFILDHTVGGFAHIHVNLTTHLSKCLVDSML